MIDVLMILKYDESEYSESIGEKMNGIMEMLKGVLEGIILEIIDCYEIYGYEIIKNLQEYGFEDIVEGIVYMIFLRLEKKGLVIVMKRKFFVGFMRKFYFLNEVGKQELELFWKCWFFILG